MLVFVRKKERARKEGWVLFYHISLSPCVKCHFTQLEEIKIQTSKYKKRIFARSGIIKFFKNNLLILIK